MGGPCLCDGREWDEMDNFLVAPFVIDGVEYASCEQYFQAQKFYDDAYRRVIMAETDGDQLWSLGQSRQHPIREDWEELKVEVMYKANKEKFLQNEQLRAVLVATQGDIRAGGFPFWAKWNAIILMLVREELKPASAKRDFALAGELREEMERYKREQRGMRIGAAAEPPTTRAR
eukprot:g730.t1